MPHPFEQARNRVTAMRKQANLLEAVDRFAPPEFLLQLAIGELIEYADEQEKHGTPNYNLADTQGEFNDIAVFYFSWLETYAPNVDMLSTIHTANGYGSHSAALENLEPVIMDSIDTPVSAVPEVMNRLASIGMHMPVPYVTFGSMSVTVDKVLSNRNPVLYSEDCPVLGRKLVDEELVLKYQHLERGTRMIRKAVNRTLVPSDWQPHYRQLVDWTNSADNLAVIEGALKASGAAGGLTTELEKAKGNLYTN
ncbi:MAG: hypothetical protein GW762_03455 [Candidatus Pacebacteria bacterium]|nr:hypothetical protein [Candidatus Paceibacterota bacterium]PIR63276.1 MAG: hypothetical protein COU64_05295 [Candidatus Pacebacteria bacterium CG10_big_fil_rev_8_21_14_0_10_40_26]PIZ79157.1 MAG: hypothetical protein COY01_01885 [Candidatus Pacebacteria bacterium CG_4_10_14_0_2_um_filter_40_20]PJA68812.1 MAG: hypothetical protein CO156_02490 [Candidatus Pacebacteria bacterium CG_4_9_14_3_um_filter_40_12]PJC42123.1 MAG: hypothetical protein CO041_00595 [Candidatus Pacebacteria bacterium CG_4_9_